MTPFCRGCGLTLSQIATVKTIKYLKSWEKKKTCKIGCLLMITWFPWCKLALQNYNCHYKILFCLTHQTSFQLGFHQIWFDHRLYKRRRKWGIHFTSILFDSKQGDLKLKNWFCLFLGAFSRAEGSQYFFSSSILSRN